MGGPRILRKISGVIVIALLGFVVFLLTIGTPVFLIRIPTSALLDVTASSIKGGSPLGYKLAYMGAILLVVSQFYSIRMRIGIHRGGLRAIPAPEWLKMHSYTGAAGAILIQIHSGFPLAFTYSRFWEHLYPGLGLVGLIGAHSLAAWLTLIVAASGILGLWLHQRSRDLFGSSFKYWLRIHVALSGALYVAGTTHLLIAVLLKHTAAI